jgi:hypothetical protein
LGPEKKSTLYFISARKEFHVHKAVKQPCTEDGDFT